MSTRRFADQRDAIGIDLVFLSVRLDPADCCLDVVGAGGKAMLWCESIVDGEPSEARFGEWFEQGLDKRLLVASDETTTVYQNAGWKWARALRNEGVERETYIAGFGEFDIGSQLRSRGRRCGLVAQRQRTRQSNRDAR